MYHEHIDKDPTNPKYVGPGAWALLHKKAMSCSSIQDNQDTLDLFILISENFGCKNCRKNTKEYIEKNDPNQYIHMLIPFHNGEKVYFGMFVYLWKFHNQVNKKLGKKEITIEEAFDLYLEKENCSEICMAA